MPALRALLGYFLYLGGLGFGGPVALVGHMQRDLVERRGWFTKDQYLKSLALSQLAPGPLAAQLAMCLGYVHSRFRGATLVGVAFILPSYAMTVALAALYVAYGGLDWMRAAFYGVGAAVIAIIARAAWKLFRLGTSGSVLLALVAVAMAALTAWFEAEIAPLFVLAGLLVMVVEAPPAWLRQLWRPEAGRVSAVAVGPILWFFAKAGAFVFGSGLAIVPFLHGGVVLQHHWLTESQFLDAVAVAMLTPGPVVITVAFIGYLVAGQAGALAAAVGVFLPVWLFVVALYPVFDRVGERPRVRAFVRGVTAAAAGAIAGACVVLARRAVVDLPTLAVAVVTLGLLLRFRIPEPVLILGAAAVGLAAKGIGGA